MTPRPVQIFTFSPFVQVGGIGDEGEEFSQPDLHLEDVEAWAPQPPKTSTLVRLLFLFIFFLCSH